MAFSTGPPVKRTGAGVDGGLNCTACHRTFAPANSDARGGVTILAGSYSPGVKQVINVIVNHPDAARWGFQLTARLASDETKPAGAFAADDVVKVLCDDGSAAPCGNAAQTQFVEHSNAPRTAAGAGFTFNVTWTPPATDVGDVVFYAAGNAANGDGTNNNDRIYTTVLRISGPCSLTQKPSVKSVVNGASFQTAWNPGAMLSIFGSNFAGAGKTRGVTAGDIVDRKFPESLGCIAVTVNGQNAPIAYVQQDQINFQSPLIAGSGPASVVVIANPGAPNELRSDAFPAAQQTYAPAFFTFDGKNIAATTATGSGIVADASVGAAAAPAKPGDVVVMYATGLGQTTPAFTPGDIATAAAQTAATVGMTVGGIAVPAADVLYAGVSPQSICGLQQINVKLPLILPDGDLPVTLSVNGAQSPAGAVIAVKK